MPVTAHDFADELRRRIPGLPKKKLHKLLYYVQGTHLASTGQVAFDDRIEAWTMGPVVAGLWADEEHGRPRPAPTALSASHLESLDTVLQRYGHLSGAQLERMTHDEDPWVDAHDANKVITVAALSTWFGQVAEHRRRTDPRLRREASPSMRAAVAQALAEDPVVHQRLA